jgi:D-apionolactonase
VLMRLEAGAQGRAEVETNPRCRTAAPMPFLGTGLPVVRPVLDDGLLAVLQGLGLGAVALEIDPEVADWADKLARHLAALPGRVRLNCRMGAETDYETVLGTIATILAGRRAAGISLWGASREAVPFARGFWPDIPLGGGTGAFFTELNRSSLPPGVDYATWTTNPTVHASDDDTLGESIEPLPDILATAHAKAPGLDLVIGPLTLGMRFNPNATSAQARQAEPPADPRQHTPLAASWLLGTIAGLIDPSVKELIVFEASGPKGLVLADGSLSPAGHLVSRLAPLAGCPAEIVTWAHEPRARGLLIRTPHGRVLAVTQARAVPANLELPEGRWGAPEPLGPSGFTAGAQPSAGRIDVDGFGVVWLAEAS